MDVADDPILECDRHEHDILDALLEMAGARRAHMQRRLRQPVAKDRHIVRREAPHRVAVRAHDAEIRPAHRHVVRPTQFPVVQVLAHAPDGAVEQERVADHQGQVASGGGLEELVALRDGGGERLLDEDVLAGMQRLETEAVM